MNECQEPEWYSFPLFSICGHLAGFMYPVKQKRVKHFLTLMTISGEGFSTGKSLLCDACMFALYGDKLDCSAPSSVPKLFDMLGSGIPIFGKPNLLFLGHFPSYLNSMFL